MKCSQQAILLFTTLICSSVHHIASFSIHSPCQLLQQKSTNNPDKLTSWNANEESKLYQSSNNHNVYEKEEDDDTLLQTSPSFMNRRSILSKSAKSILTASLGGIFLESITTSIPQAEAAVGTLPEFQNTNAVLQGLTVNVPDLNQFKKMITFLEDSFDFLVLRRTETDVWMGFGPEQTSIPSKFEIPVSSFAMYGGHASLHIHYDSQATDIFYNGKSDTPPGNNIAYLQVGVPTYRISQMVQNGGNVLDAYGYVNVISPVGLPIRGIVGISPDPMMFVAINTEDMEKSRAFYEQLGMVEQPYPYARPSNGKGQFEPPQPEGSVYLSHTQDNMGLLLLPSVNPKNKRKKIPVVSNPVVRSLNIVYNPNDNSDESPVSEVLSTADPSSVGIAFSSVGAFEKEMKAFSSA